MRTTGALRFFVFDSLGAGVIHGIFSRAGGVSPRPWDSLNLGGTVGDNLERVQENRKRVLDALHRDPASVFDAWQVHGTQVVVADSPRSAGMPHPKADILLTDRPEVSLLMRFADCVPILLHDPVHRAVGMAHAGWLGTVSGAAREAVQAMRENFGSRPEDILAAIGPSIGPDHYEIGPDVEDRVRQCFGDASGSVIMTRRGRTFLDLWGANQLQLVRSGVKQIETAGVCTACHTEDWFSHRAEKGRTGRFGAMIALA